MNAQGRLRGTEADRARLQAWARSTTAPHRLVLRSQIVLHLLDGRSQVSVARLLGVSRDTVCRWERRFAVEGVDALRHDRPGRGRRPGRNATHVARVVEALRTSPTGSWSVRRLAAHVGISAASVQRIWRDVERRGAQSESLSGQIVSRDTRAVASLAGKDLASRGRDLVRRSTVSQEESPCR
ncbi:MAG: helix-turn-helix domain-containing protein [Acidobacteria bacterium]|nr:helix-turn-helix domain-containing protein [Acidobacteriota bacterium]